MSDQLLPRGQLGYAMDLENREYLEDTGEDSTKLLKAYKEQVPEFNVEADPGKLVRILNQRNQGACQGHSVAMFFSICFFLATGRWLDFSRAAAYYLSQRRDGIRGDRGSTLSGGQWVSTQHGMCLESDWPYPNEYDPTEPPGIKYEYKLKVSKPLKTADEWKAWSDAGLPIAGGLKWNTTCDVEIVNNWQPLRNSGGHATTWWLRRPNGNRPNINSWGAQWNGDGIHEWTMQSIERALKDPFTVFIGYAPDEMMFAPQQPLGGN